MDVTDVAQRLLRPNSRLQAYKWPPLQQRFRGSQTATPHLQDKYSKSQWKKTKCHKHHPSYASEFGVQACLVHRDIDICDLFVVYVPVHHFPAKKGTGLREMSGKRHLTWEVTDWDWICFGVSALKIFMSSPNLRNTVPFSHLLVAIDNYYKPTNLDLETEM